MLFEQYNYAITVWTKIQGLRIEYLFVFDDGLFGALGVVREYHTGEYIDVPFENLPLPSAGDLEYWRTQQ